jgi:tRNA threonylcarbamoyladenosine biosynthesis protein TsaB
MISLAQLLASHGCILVLDAASTTVQVGLLRAGASAVWHTSAGEAGKALFAGADAGLRDAGATLEAVRAFVFCEGPGSMLGIRTVAMAIRTWQAVRPRPAYRYQSLALLACELRHRGKPAPFSVIADARRESWHCVTVTAAGKISPLRRAASPELAASAEPLYQPAAFRAWAPAPRAAQACTYDVASLLAGHTDEDLFSPTGAPDAFQYEAPVYKKWSAQVHRAATVDPK